MYLYVILSVDGVLTNFDCGVRLSQFKTATRAGRKEGRLVGWLVEVGWSIDRTKRRLDRNRNPTMSVHEGTALITHFAYMCIFIQKYYSG